MTRRNVFACSFRITKLAEIITWFEVGELLSHIFIHVAEVDRRSEWQALEGH